MASPAPSSAGAGPRPAALPRFPSGARPAPESRRHSLLVRGVAVLALVATAAYLTWRIAATLDPGVWWASLAMLGLELHAAVGLGLFVFSLWDVDAGPRAAPATTAGARVTVLIPTYNEPEEVLLPTVAAAVALEPAHETWVLDDGNRPDVRRLATELGARYVARPDRRHAKAGNLNHALGLLDTEFVAVLDADHVPAPGFLTATLGYFGDEDVALVQTPQDFYNLDSFEHAEATRRSGLGEQSLFYRAIQPGKNRWGAAFWCGTGAVLRVAALDAVGGVALGSVTEDIHTTIRLHRAGWRTVYHNEVLARGLAAGNAKQYLLQRRRWGTGAMQVLREDNPLVGRGLTLAQRLAYMATLLGWFDAWRTLGYVVLPVLVLLTGASPVRASAGVFLPAFGAVLVGHQTAIWLLGRGYARPLFAVEFEMVRMPSNLAATLTLLRPTPVDFRVTPKGRVGRRRERDPGPALLWLLLTASALALAWCAATMAGATPLHYGTPWTVLAAAGWLLVNAGFLVAALRRIRSPRFSVERRRSVRLDVSLPARIFDADCRVGNLSLTGALVETPTPPDVGDQIRLVVGLPGPRAPLEFSCFVRSRVDRDGLALCGVEFLPGQRPALARLTRALFQEYGSPAVLSVGVDEAGRPAGMAA
ncbi:hypothetical protein BH20ACT9_BH20ACT9_21060 [soil metagenome]